MGNRRAQRVGREIVEALSEIVGRHVGDPRLQSVTFTAARVTPDLRHVRVFFAGLGEGREAAEIGEALAKASGYLRGELSRRLALRYSPALEFTYDETLERAGRISSLLGEGRSGQD